MRDGLDVLPLADDRRTRRRIHAELIEEQRHQETLPVARARAHAVYVWGADDRRADPVVCQVGQWQDKLVDVTVHARVWERADRWQIGDV